MKRTLTIIIILFNYSAHAQSNILPDILIRYSNDTTIVLSGFMKQDSNSMQIIDCKSSPDTIIEYYTLKFELTTDSSYFNLIQNHEKLDSVSFSQLLHKSKLTMDLIKYGYGGAKNYEQLTEKYGVKYYAGGCTYTPSEIEKQYSRYMSRLLTIRNGSNWEEKYKKEISKLK